MKKPTSFDVARHAGVHRSVVSRALSGTGRISDETRAKVIAAAKELGYHVNLLARGLQDQRSGLVGLVASRLDTPYRARQVKVAARELLAKGYHPVLIAAEGDDAVGGLIERLLSYSVSGVIVTSDTPPDEIIDECARLEVPVVLVNRDVSASDADRVQLDIEASGQMAFDMLSAPGHRRFGALVPQTRTYSVAGRAQAFCRAARAAGHSVQLFHPEGQDYTHGLRMAEAIAVCACDLDAIFATTDPLAMGLMDGLRHRHGLSVPGDLDIVGFDDIAEAGWISYDLSTVQQDVEGAAIKAVDLILARIETPARPYETHQISISPVHRSTTRRVPR